MNIWAGIFAPKGVQKEVVDKLAAALNKALDDPAVQKRLAELGGSLPAKSERTPATFDGCEGGDRALVADPQGRIGVRRRELSIVTVLDSLLSMAPRVRCTPSPLWGEGGGEGVQDLSGHLNPSPHPSPYGRGSRPNPLHRHRPKPATVLRS